MRAEKAKFLSRVRNTRNRFRVNQSIFMGGPKAEKLETSYFNFGSYDWSLSVYSSGRSDSVLGKSYFYTCVCNQSYYEGNVCGSMPHYVVHCPHPSHKALFAERFGCHF